MGTVTYTTVYSDIKIYTTVQFYRATELSEYCAHCTLRAWTAEHPDCKGNRNTAEIVIGLRRNSIRTLTQCKNIRQKPLSSEL